MITDKTSDSILGPHSPTNLTSFLQIEEINMFVHVVNNTVRIQEETERVKDVMNRITTYNVGDVPHELRDVSIKLVLTTSNNKTQYIVPHNS